MVDNSAKPKKLRRTVPRLPLDEVDLNILRLLEKDGRMSNVTLARSVGVAESTCLARVRALRESGVIRAIRAEIDPAAVGRPVQAIIAVQFTGHQRATFDEFNDEIPQVPGVLGIFHLSGSNDYLVHVAATSVDTLRDFVLDHLTRRSGIAHAETSVVFAALRGEAGLFGEGGE